MGAFQRRDRQGALPRVRVVSARRGKALPHGRASDFRFFRLFGARIVSPFQSFVAAYARLLVVQEGQSKIAQRFTRVLMKRETHRHMFLFATSFSWWLEDVQITLEPAEAGSTNKILDR